MIDIPDHIGGNDDGGDVGDVIHTCVQCGHGNLNLEPDEDGDYVCEECGHVIPEDNAVAASGQVCFALSWLFVGLVSFKATIVFKLF